MGCANAIGGSTPVNKGESDVTTTTARLTNGIDTLVIGWKGELRQDIRDTLAEAREAGAGTRDWPISLGGRTMVVLPYSRPFYRWIVQDGQIIVSISEWDGDHPTVLVRFLSQYLWEVGPEEAVDEVRRWLQELFYEWESETVSRVDLCADMLPSSEDEAYQVLSNLALVVSRARKRETFWEGSDPSELWIGRGGAIQARVYDKSREIASGNGDKSWFWDVWGIPEGSAQVIRAEFQITRDALREAEITDWDSLVAVLPSLWSYLTTEWFRLALQDDERQNRRTVHPWWAAVQAAWLAFQEGAGVFVRARRAQAVREFLVRAARGYLVSMAAMGDGTLRSVLQELAGSFGPAEWREKVRLRAIARGGLALAT